MTNAGLWPFAILMIVIVSWVVYRYLAPRGEPRWSSDRRGRMVTDERGER